MEVSVGDDTGLVTLSVRGDKASVLEVGKTVRIQNGHVAMIKGFIRLSIDKWATVKPAEKEEEIASVSEAKDISGVEYELTKN